LCRSEAWRWVFKPIWEPRLPRWLPSMGNSGHSCWASEDLSPMKSRPRYTRAVIVGSACPSWSATFTRGTPASWKPTAEGSINGLSEARWVGVVAQSARKPLERGCRGQRRGRSRDKPAGHRLGNRLYNNFITGVGDQDAGEEPRLRVSAARARMGVRSRGMPGWGERGLEEPSRTS
jgi:hypothetical protein